MNYVEVYKAFTSEFGSIKDKFISFDLGVDEANDCDADCVWHPGVYVWFHEEEGVLRVGRSLSNSRKRALEHIGANTGGKILSYSKDSKTRIFLFNVRNIEDYHWVAALEIYFENVLSPKIGADRQG